MLLQPQPLHVQIHHLLIGPPGSGKTVQGRLAGAFVNRICIDMSRVLKIGGKFVPGLSNRIAHYVSEGEPVPNEITMTLFDTYLQTFQKGSSFVFVGVPRMESQVLPFIDSVEQHLGFNQFVVGDMDLTLEVAMQRIEKRARADEAKGITPRPDDLNPRVVKGRLDDWGEKKQGLLSALRAQLNGCLKIVQIKCYEDPQQTILGVIDAFELRDHLFVRPEGLLVAA